MCLAIPLKLVSVDGNDAIGEVGGVQGKDVPVPPQPEAAGAPVGDVVGVVKDAKYSSVKQTPPRVYYTPWRQGKDPGAFLAASGWPTGSVGFMIQISRGESASSDGRRSRAAAAVGSDGLMVEVHHEPSQALSDASQAIVPDELAQLMQQLPHLLPLTGRHMAQPLRLSA